MAPIKAIHVNPSISVRIPIPKDRLAFITSVHQFPKDQASEKTVLTLFCPVFSFKLMSVTTNACHDEVKTTLLSIGLERIIYSNIRIMPSIGLHETQVDC